MRKEDVADDLGLLFEPVAAERAAGDDVVPVATEGVAREREEKSATLLRLPDMGHFVDEEPLALKRLFREILRPAPTVGMEMDVAGRGHRASPRLQRPPFAAEQPHFGRVD